MTTAPGMAVGGWRKEPAKASKSGVFCQYGFVVSRQSSLLEPFVEKAHEEVKSLLLDRVGAPGAVRLAIDEGKAVVGMVEARPGAVLARLPHPLVCELEDALQMVAVAPDMQDRRADAADAAHCELLVGVLLHDRDVLVLNLVLVARRGGPGVHAEELVRCAFYHHAGRERNLRDRLHDQLAAVAHADRADGTALHPGLCLEVAD